MRISGLNWFAAFAISVLVHVNIAFGWLFLSSNEHPLPQPPEKEPVRVSLGQWAQSLTIDPGGAVKVPEASVTRSVTREGSTSAVSSISPESRVLGEVVRDVYVQQIQGSPVQETNLISNEYMHSEDARPEESRLARPVFDVAAAARPKPVEELPARAEPVQSRQLDTEQTESARINTAEKPASSVGREQITIPVEQAKERTAGQPSRDHSANRQERVSQSEWSRQESKGQQLTSLPQGEVNPAISEEKDSAVRREYEKALLSRLDAHKRYPDSARRRGATGVAKVRLTILADGSIESSELVESSGNRHLDREALRMFLRAEPFPPIPISLQKNRIDLEIPIVFELN